ncbi:hypothetical protein RchiOBHm_Chr5g0053541 [Rosa chinensis]|uniref:Uncharacterized protein n=1 Tax=Rosa chinensis TaxID=74649 RepID=A0A2P6QFX8_ROSCH|nr:hypothetical protein RchiOBHm_Chr5g0053541 [Rosa chinensis]
MKTGSVKCQMMFSAFRSAVLYIFLNTIVERRPHVFQKMKNLAVIACTCNIFCLYLKVLGRPAEYQVLIIGSHDFNALAIEVITEVNELNKEMIYRHCVLVDDAWPVVSTVDLDLIVVEFGIVVNMGLKEFQDILRRWRRELAFRGAIFKSPPNISLVSRIGRSHVCV